MSQVSNDLLVAYPVVDPFRCNRLAELAKIIKVHIAVDSIFAVNAIAAGAQQHGATIGILVDLDVGYHRMVFNHRKLLCNSLSTLTLPQVCVSMGS